MHIHERLVAENKTRLVEPFDPTAYNANGSVGENLLFGVTVTQGLSDGALLAKPENRAVLREFSLRLPLAQIGVQIAETMLEIFVGLPPGRVLAATRFPTLADINIRHVPGTTVLIDKEPDVPNPRLVSPLNVRASNGVIHTINRVLIPVNL